MIIMETDKEKIERITQIIEDLYINYIYGTLDVHMRRVERVKEITDLIFDKKRDKNKDLDYIK